MHRKTLAVSYTALGLHLGLQLWLHLGCILYCILYCKHHKPKKVQPVGTPYSIDMLLRWSKETDF